MEKSTSLFNMHNSVSYILSFFIILIVYPDPTFSERRCRCLSNDPTCWPITAVWQNFNASINGRLISPQPSAAICNLNPSNINGCNTTSTQWNNPFWRGDQVGALQNHNWENSSCSIYYNSTTCNQGSVPVYAVDAILPEHVQTTLRFVNDYNLRLVMKTSGHDYLGRSTAFGSLLLWFHHMKNMTLMSNFSLCTGEVVMNAIRLDAGVQWGDVYDWLAPYNLTAIGGASGTVGATGGFLQGGGHGPLTRWKGLAVDQVLEFDVITASGLRERVNACENPDLFWALRGGGGGTYAVVLSVVLRTYSSPPVVFSVLSVIAPNETRYNSFVHNFVGLLPALADAGWAGYFYLVDQQFMSALLLPNGNADVANATMNQIINDYGDFYIVNASITPFPLFNSLYNTILKRTNPTGGNVLLGSRLIPDIIVRNQTHQVADTFLQVKGRNQSVLIGHLVAGGQVSNVTQNTSVNPAWRTALLHMIYAQSWFDWTSHEDQEKLATHVTEQVEILQTITDGAQSGSYMNEANPNEPNWRRKFFGSMENYNRLKSIKNTVDPNGLFVCKNCVGSDDWSDDLNCPKVSSGREIQLHQSLLITSIFTFIFKVYL